MIDCDGCGKRHRDKERVIECRVRAKKRAEKAALRAADDQRREDNLADMSVADRIALLYRQGTPRASIPKALRENYPMHADPTGRKFDSVSIVLLEHPRKWPMNEEPVVLTPLEHLALLRVQRELGATVVPPVDRVGRFVSAWEKFHRAAWTEKTPWSVKHGQGAKWAGWGSMLQEHIDAQFDRGAEDREDDV